MKTFLVRYLGHNSPVTAISQLLLFVAGSIGTRQKHHQQSVDYVIKLNMFKNDGSKLNTILIWRRAYQQRAEIDSNDGIRCVYVRLSSRC